MAERKAAKRVTLFEADMTPNLIECPACHSDNPSTATECSRCRTPLPVGDSTFVGEGAGSSPAQATPISEDTSLGNTPPGDQTDISGGQGWSQPAKNTAAFRLGRLPPGTRLGARYEIVQMLGEGGMGAVYKAMDRELERMVALKIIRPELAVHEEILARFKQELILARRITHKNVIRIFDLGDADGVKFITMEFIEGKDLNSVIKEKGRLSFEECAETVSQICTALDAAHSEGVVHRDLKPQNVMIDKSGRVIVMDFGIARTMEQGGGMTNTGALIGTPDYMSPEQVMGEKVDPRSDLFTLGVIFFQLLVGTLPYKADTIQAAMYKRTKEKSKSPQEVDPTVPALLSDITVKSMQLDPNLRYQTAKEIQLDIESWRSGSTKRLDIPVAEIEVPPVPLWRKPIVLGSAALLLLALGGVYYGGRKSMGPVGGGIAAPVVVAPVASLAILPFHNASGDSKLDWLGSSMAEMLSTDVGQSASVRMVSADRVGQVLKDLRITPQSDLDPSTVGRIANLSNVDTVVWGHYAQFGDHIRIDATVQDLKKGHSVTLKEEATSEKDILPVVDRLAAQIRENLSVSKSLLKELQEHAFKPSTTSVSALRLYNDGLQQARLGNHSQAVSNFQNAIHEDSQFALAYSKMGQAYEELGQDDEAEQASQKAVSLSENLPAQEKYLIQASHDGIVKDYGKAVEAYQNLVKVSPDNTDYLFALAGAHENAGAYDKAKELYAKVVQLDPKRIEGLLAMGRINIETGNTQNGIDFLTRAQGMAVELGDDAERAQVLQALGVAYWTMQRYDDALKNLQDSLDIKKRLGLKKGIADSLEQMGSIYDDTGKADLALKNYNAALALRREIGDKQGTANVLADLGDFYVEHGKYDDALRLFKESLQSQIDVHNESSQGRVLNNIGNTYLAKGDFDNARTYFTQALEVREKLKMPTDIADTLHNLAETSVKTGQFDQAQEQYLKALEIRRNEGDKKGAALESSGLGTMFGYQGRLAAALSSQEDALKSLQDAKEKGFWTTEIMLAYGNALAQAGRGEEAAKALTDALNSARAEKSQPEIATALSYQGDNALYRGDLKTAATAYAEALSSASKTGDADLILLTKINMARLSIQQGKFAAAVTALRGLGEQADALGLKYLSIECLVLSGQAMVGMKDYAGAQKELKTASVRSEKQGLRLLAAQSHYQMGRALELSGKPGDAASQYDEARRIVKEIQRETQSDAITKRTDLAPLFAASKG
jgi:eukaryotic-like serine/threonine-protein kinase